jgi:hypothetical protein
MARSLRINYPNALYHVTCRGTEPFLNKIKKAFQKGRNREQPLLQAIHRILAERVIGEVCRILHLNEEAISRRGFGSVAREEI